LENDQLILRGNLLSVDGIRKLEVEKKLPLERSYSLGVDAALEILDQGGDKIMEAIRKNEG
jgi:hydroxymethylbilane synthase